MCGIGGFSLSNTSKLNPRKLSNSLLTEMDIRGNQASGYAYQSRNASGFYKNAVAGAKLNLKGMPKSAQSVILHTRYATHGKTSVQANNHPVQSPDSSISLVHNGVIYNHDLVRAELDGKLPEVDTSVIPAILQQFDRNTDKFSMLDGDAAVAWLDENDLGVLKVARISHSPLFIAQLKDGSFVFASTESILKSALKRAGVKAEFMTEVQERKLLTVRAGRLDGFEDLPETDPKFQDSAWYSYGNYRNMTSGGHGIGYGKPSDTTPKVVRYASAFGDVEVPESWELAGDEFLSTEFPEVFGLDVNNYGEYFDGDGNYVGTVEDLVYMGYIDEHGNTYAWDDYASAYAPRNHYQETAGNKFYGGVYGMWD